MTALVATVLFFISLTLGCASLVAKGRERAFLWRTILLAWVVFIPFVVFVNEWLPFAGGGDDEGYFRLAATPIHSLSDVFDFTRFVGLIEQPGYPWLLSLLNHFTGQDLLAFKLLNLTLLILLAVVWYRIGTLLESPVFGRVVAIGVLLLMPLWYYVLFLFKDMTIVLLQGIFLLGLVEQRQRRNTSWRAWLLIGAATLALIPFRSVLVLQNIAILVAALMLQTLKNEQRSNRIMPLILGGGVVVGLLVLASNPAIMASLGIQAENRILSSTAIMEDAVMRREQSRMNRTLFPVLYLLTETAGLNWQAWAKLDGNWLRGVMALPWMIFVVPFFMLGLHWLTRVPKRKLRRKRARGRLLNSRLVASPWSALVLFVMSYFVVSWQVGDTTRWRIPDIPVIATIAMGGWFYAAQRTRQYVLIFWVTGSSALFSMFYFFKVV